MVDIGDVGCGRTTSRGYRMITVVDNWSCVHCWKGSPSDYARLRIEKVANGWMARTFGRLCWGSIMNEVRSKSIQVSEYLECSTTELLPFSMSWKLDFFSARELGGQFVLSSSCSCLRSAKDSSRVALTPLYLREPAFFSNSGRGSGGVHV